MIRFSTKSKFTVVLILFLFAFQNESNAQVPENEKADFCFDLQLNKVFDDPLLQLMLPKFMSAYVARNTKDFPTPVVKRIFGAYGFSPDLKFPMVETPGNLRIHFQTFDENGVKVLAHFFKLNGKKETIRGKELLVSTKFPMKLYFETRSPKELIAYTSGYVNDKSLLSLFGKSLSEAWKKQDAKKPVRISFGVKEKQNAIQTIMKRMERWGTKNMIGFYGVLEGADAANFFWDPDATVGKELFGLHVFGDQENIEPSSKKALASVKSWLNAKRSLFELLKEDPVGNKFVKEFESGMQIRSESGVQRLSVLTANSSADMHKKIYFALRRMSSFQPLVYSFLRARDYEKEYGKYPFGGDDAKNWRLKLIDLMKSKERYFGPNPNAGFMIELFGFWSPKSNFIYVPLPEFAGKTWSKSDIANPEQTIALMYFEPAVDWRSKDNPTIDEILRFVKKFDGPVVPVVTYNGDVRCFRSDIDKATLMELLSASKKTIEGLEKELRDIPEGL